MMARNADRREDRGQVFAFVLALVGLGLSALVGVHGSAVAASVLAVVAIGGPAAALVLAVIAGRAHRP